MKKLLFLLAVSIASITFNSTTASAQENEKVVTGTISYLVPFDIQMLDEYISRQMYSGTDAYSGWNIKLSAFYKRQDKLSWDLYFNALTRSSKSAGVDEILSNPAGTQQLKYDGYTIGYGTYYHWNFGEKLMIKTGGMLDLYGAKKESVPDGLNNYFNMEGQIMLKAQGAIKYGWDFQKWALDLHARFSLPLFGIISADHPSEPAVSIIGNDHSVLNPAYNHFFLASYHNYMSLDYDMGIDFVLKPFTITLGFGSTNKWWNVYDIQNIRKINYMTLGVALDIVPRSKFKSSNTNF